MVGQKSYISNDDITKLPFITTLIKETLRLYAPATGVMRVVRKEVVLDGWRLPSGTELIVSYVPFISIIGHHWVY